METIILHGVTYRVSRDYVVYVVLSTSWGGTCLERCSTAYGEAVLEEYTK